MKLDPQEAARFEQFADDAERARKSLAEAAKKTDDIGKAIEELGKSNLKDIPNDLSSITAMLNITGRKLGKTEKDAISAILKEKKLTEEAIKAQLKYMDSLNEVTKKTKEDVSGLVDAMSAPIDAMISKLQKSKIGNAIVKSLGFDTIAKNMKEKMTDALQPDENGKIGFAKIQAAAGEMFKGIGEMARAALANPIILLIAAVAALGILAYKRMKETQKTLEAIRTEAGILGDESNRLLKDVREVNIEAAQFGVTVELAGKSAIALSNEFQNSSRVTKDLVKATSLLQTGLGMAAEEAAQYMQVMQSAGDLTDTQAANTAGLVLNLAKAGGVAPKKVLQDMAKSGEVLNKWLRGNTTEFLKQGVALARMGSSYEKAGSQAEKLLDWDTSITNEMNASVMMGKHLDLSMARYYAFAGKLDKMTEQISAQVGGLDEFDKQNAITKQAIADSVGLTVGELTKQLKQQKELNKMLPEQRKAYDAAQLKLTDLNEGMGILADAQKQVATTQMSQAFDKLITVLSTILMPLMNALVIVFGVVAGALNIVTGLVEGAAKWLDSLGTTGKALTVILEVLLGMLSLGIAIFIGWKMWAKHAAKATKELSKEATDAGKAVGKGLGEGIKAAGEGMKAGASGFAAFGASLITFVPIGLVLAVIIAAIALALFGLAEVVKALAPIIIVLINGIVEIVKAAIKGVIDAIYAITYSIKELVGLAPMMFVAAGGIVAMAGALILFGQAALGGGLMAGIGSLLGGGGGVVGQLVRLAELSEPLKTVAASIVQLAAALGTFSNLNIANLERAVSSLQSLIPLSPLIIATAIPIMAAGAAITAVTGGGGGGGTASTTTNNAEVVSRLDELIALIKQGSDVNMDGQKVGRVLARQIAHPVVTSTG